MKLSIKIGLSLFALLFFFACETENPLPAPEPKVNTFLALGHTRTNDNSTIDQEVAQMDFDDYDLLLLPGDIAWSASRDTSILHKLDTVFGIRKESTLWGLGNHDYSNPDLVEAFTGRSSFYHYAFNKISFVVLDTEDSLSSFTQPQHDLLESVIDTLSETTHLILLHHKLNWMYGHPDLEHQINDITNGGSGDCSWCTNPNNFYEKTYPLLLKAKDKGVEVICLAGDIGKFSKSFEFLTSEGIYLIATGIEYDQSGNQALLFTYLPEFDDLHWQFKLLSELF